MANKISNLWGQITTHKKKEEKLAKRKEELDKREKELEKREKELKKKEEESINEVEKMSRRSTVLELLPKFKKRIVIKQILLLSLPMIICVVGVWLLLSKTDILQYINKALVGDGVVLHVVFILCIVFAFALLSYLVYLIVGRFHRNQSAIQKIKILELRLNIYTDKDIVELYRLDRELEMIYRILES